MVLLESCTDLTLKTETDSRLSPFSRRFWSGTQGFSIVEVLITVALILLITAIYVPQINFSLKESLNDTIREISSSLKEAYSATLVTRNVHRLVYDMDQKAFWVESGPPEFLLHNEKTLEAEENRLKWITKDKKPPPQFKIETSITRKKYELPRGIVFKDVVTEISNKPVTEGTVYTHIFPHGLAERTVIHLADKNDNQITLVILPLLGQIKILEGYVKKEDAFD